MNKSIIVGFGAFVLGGVTGVLLSKQYFEKKYEKLAQEEIDSVKWVFAREKERDQGTINEVADILEDMTKKIEDFEKKDIRPAVPPVSVRTSLDDNPYEKAKRDYSLISKIETEPVPDPLVEAVIGDEVIDTSKPYLLDEIQYYEENDHFEKITLVYFRDGVLCDENEDFVDDIAHTIGEYAYSLLNNNPAPMWVRNEPLSVDYEIVIMAHGYGEVMDPNSEDGRMRRRKPNEEQ